MRCTCCDGLVEYVSSREPNRGLTGCHKGDPEPHRHDPTFTDLTGLEPTTEPIARTVVRHGPQEVVPRTIACIPGAVSSRMALRSGCYSPKAPRFGDRRIPGCCPVFARSCSTSTLSCGLAGWGACNLAPPLRFESPDVSLGSLSHPFALCYEAAVESLFVLFQRRPRPYPMGFSP